MTFVCLRINNRLAVQKMENYQGGDTSCAVRGVLEDTSEFSPNAGADGSIDVIHGVGKVSQEFQKNV